MVIILTVAKNSPAAIPTQRPKREPSLFNPSQSDLQLATPNASAIIHAHRFGTPILFSKSAATETVMPIAMSHGISSKSVIFQLNCRLNVTQETLSEGVKSVHLRLVASEKDAQT